MKEADIMDLEYAPDKTKPDELKKLPKKSLKKLYHVVLWRAKASSHQSGLITSDEWINLDRYDFTIAASFALWSSQS